MYEFQRNIKLLSPAVPRPHCISNESSFHVLFNGTHEVGRNRSEKISRKENTFHLIAHYNILSRVGFKIIGNRLKVWSTWQFYKMTFLILTPESCRNLVSSLLMCEIFHAWNAPISVKFNNSLSNLNKWLHVALFS